MSSSSTTAGGSRSPSPATPESSDSPEPVTIRDEEDHLNSWRLSSGETKSLSPTTWENAPSILSNGVKAVEEHMLSLNDLIHRHAYEDTSALFSQETNTRPLVYAESSSASPLSSSAPHSPSQNAQSPDVFVPPFMSISSTKPVPPPALQPRRPSAAAETVICPPKESCFNLPVIVPSVPETGTKSRVETQIRVVVDLACPTSGVGETFKYDKVGSWKWLKLPKGTSTKKRTRKEGKIDPLPEDVLHLTAEVTCATAPHNRVISCSSCRTREAKRVARKLAARVRPPRSDSDHDDSNPSHPPQHRAQEDTTSIIQFNCPEILPFHGGSVVLPMRITCYCRHHREKVGFYVNFTMFDGLGRCVGVGRTPGPIMITDDHKTPKLGKGVCGSEDGSQFGGVESSGGGGSAKRKNTSLRDGGQVQKRPKPYEDGLSRGSSVTSPSMSPSMLAFSPNSFDQIMGASQFAPPPPSNFGGLVSPGTAYLGSDMSDPEAYLPSPANSYASGGDAGPQNEGCFNNAIDSSGAVGIQRTSLNALEHQHQQQAQAQMHSPTFLPTAPPSPVSPPLSHGQLTAAPAHPSPSTSSTTTMIPTQVQPLSMPFTFTFPHLPTGTPAALPPPKIHRLIPGSGPTHGGIEITILGANFHPSLQLNCVFGDVVASSTHRWSDNTLVCVLPPRIEAGVVVVWFDGVEKEERALPTMFTYVDESDRALMELALQVVGLKMTGKLEDAKNVAMRIVGNATSEDSSSQMEQSNMMQVASLSILRSGRGVRPLLLSHANDSGDFETLIVNFLSLLDISQASHRDVSMSEALSHQTSAGQTLLHLATMLKFPRLVRFLIDHDIDLDVRDHNGFTAAHFAALVRSKECLRLLVDAGTALDVVNILGETAEEIAPPDFFDELYSDYGEEAQEDVSDPGPEEDEEAVWGDGEDESADENVASRIARNVRSERPSVKEDLQRPSSTSQGGTPASQKTSESTISSPLSKSTEKEKGKEKEKQASEQDSVDEKNAAASFANMVQRTIAQFQPYQGIIPNIPHLPLPHIPGMPAVPWGALPQLPMVFPVYVPIPGWSSLVGDKRGHDVADREKENVAWPGSVLSPQEWRTFWEKWMKQITASSETHPAHDDAPPAYSPRSEDRQSETLAQAGPSSQMGIEPQPAVVPLPTAPERAPVRRLAYDSTAVPDQEVNAYTYRPVKKPTQKLKKKHDRMLVLFWIPTLFVGFIWVFLTALRISLHILKATVSLKTGIRI